MLRAARAWGARPTEFLREWSEKDRGLALALVTLEETTTAEGLPWKIATDDEAMSWKQPYVMAENIAATHLEEYRRVNKDLPAGAILGFKDYEPDI